MFLAWIYNYWKPRTTAVPQPVATQTLSQALSPGARTVLQNVDPEEKKLKDLIFRIQTLRVIILAPLTEGYKEDFHDWLANGLGKGFLPGCQRFSKELDAVLAACDVKDVYIQIIKESFYWTLSGCINTNFKPDRLRNFLQWMPALRDFFMERFQDKNSQVYIFMKRANDLYESYLFQLQKKPQVGRPLHLSKLNKKAFITKLNRQLKKTPQVKKTPLESTTHVYLNLRSGVVMQAQHEEYSHAFREVAGLRRDNKVVDLENISQQIMTMRASGTIENIESAPAIELDQDYLDEEKEEATEISRVFQLRGW